VVTAPSQDASPDEGRLPPGTRFGAYEIVRTLGAGAFGSVYEAIRHPLGNRFALKVLHPELVTSGKIVARFMREAEATVKVRHPHVVSTFEVGVVDRTPFLAMDFLVGETLRARMRRAGPMPLALVADLLVPVCSAVAAVHDHRIVHRDLKPDNIMITEPRPGVLHPTVLDFGVARALSPDGLLLTTAARAIGTPLYMSPEQLLDPDTVDARSDQWALGVILYACLSGALPYDAKTLPELMVKIASSAPIPLESRVAGLPPAVVQLVGRALQHDRARRFASAREIGAALAIGERTVHTHFAHLLAKLDAANRQEAVARATACGLIAGPPRC
jgi:serine/threonine-protein kinase